MARLEAGGAAVDPGGIADRAVGADGGGDPLNAAGWRAYSAVEFSISDGQGIGIGGQADHVAIGSGSERVVGTLGAVKAVGIDVIAVGVVALQDDHGTLDREGGSGLGFDADNAGKQGPA